MKYDLQELSTTRSKFMEQAEGMEKKIKLLQRPNRRFTIIVKLTANTLPDISHLNIFSDLPNLNTLLCSN